MRFKKFQKILVGFFVLNLANMLNCMDDLPKSKFDGELPYVNNLQIGLNLSIELESSILIENYLKYGAFINLENKPIKKIDWSDDKTSFFKKIIKREKKDFARGEHPPLFKALTLKYFSNKSSPNPEIIELLCQKGANVNERFLKTNYYYSKKEGITPLHYLIGTSLLKNESQIQSCIDILLKYGANPATKVNFCPKNLIRYMQELGLPQYDLEKQPEKKSLFLSQAQLINGSSLDHALFYGAKTVIEKVLVPTILAILSNPEQDENKLEKFSECIENNAISKQTSDLLAQPFSYAHIQKTLKNNERICDELVNLIHNRLNLEIKERFDVYLQNIDQIKGVTSLYNNSTIASDIKNLFNLEDPKEIRKKHISNYFEKMITSQN